MKNLLSMLENLFVAVTFAESGEYQKLESPRTDVRNQGLSAAAVR